MKIRFSTCAMILTGGALLCAGEVYALTAPNISPRSFLAAQASHVPLERAAFVNLSIGMMLMIALSAWAGSARWRKKTPASPRPSAPTLPAKPDGWAFDLVVAETFRRLGFAVAIMPADGPDGGLDLELRRGQELVLVQCHVGAENVSVEKIRAFVAVVADQQADRGIFITAAHFTPEAEALGLRHGLELMGEPELNILIHEVSQPDEDLWQAEHWIDELSAAVTLRKPWCPTCGETMKLSQDRERLAWHCLSRPRCRGNRTARAELLDPRKIVAA